MTTFASVLVTISPAAVRVKNIPSQARANRARQHSDKVAQQSVARSQDTLVIAEAHAPGMPAGRPIT